MRVLPLLAAAAMLAGCGGAPETSQGVVRYLGIDQSISTEDQPDLWIRAAHRLVVDRLDFGDTIVVLGVHDRTGEAAPLLELTIPLPGDGQTSELAARKALAATKEQVTAVVRDALLKTPRARYTDVLSIFERVRALKDGRPMSIVLLSDAIHSVPGMDFNRIDFAAEPGLAREITEERHWPADLLANATVEFILDSPRTRPAQPRRVLREFYAALLEGLGGRLGTFEATAGLGVATQEQPARGGAE